MNARKNIPSRFKRFCLGVIADEHLRESIREDLECQYAWNREKKGDLSARTTLLGKLLLIAGAFLLKNLIWRTLMFNNYLKITLRNIQRHKGYSFINIAGLAVGMACTALILLWVQDELSFDRFHTAGDRIYRVVFSTSDDGSPTNANGSFGVGPAMKREFPEVLECVRFRKMGQGVKRYVGYKDQKFYETKFFFAEPSVFQMFDFPLLKGDPVTALVGPNSIVLSEAAARKYFGEKDPLGQVLEADPYNDGDLMLFRITGIAKNVPSNSHIHFDFLASYRSQREDTDSFNGFYQNFTYVLLNQESAAVSLQPKLLDFLHRNWREDPWYTLGLQPLRDIHLHSRLRSEIEPTGDILYVYVFTVIAGLILLIACFNFMNLTTARALKRAQEVGIRKMVGARRNQLMAQYLGESLLFSLFSALSALGIVLLMLPLFNRLTDKTLTPLSLADPTLLAAAVSVILGVGFISGIYPALVLSGFSPLNTLKSQSSGSGLGSVLRKGLVFVQFAISIGIISGTLIVQKQMKFIQERNLGFDRGQILVIPLNKDLRKNYTGFRDELLKYAGILNATTSAYVPTRGSLHYSFHFEGREDDLSQVVYLIDREFVDTYGLRLLTGKDIRNPISSQSDWEIMVSELTTKEAGYASPSEAVGKSFKLEEDSGQIVGVVNDINIYSLRRTPHSITYLVTPISNHNYVSIRFLPQDLKRVLAHIQKTWQEKIPAYPLDYFFLDESFLLMHRSERKMGEIFSVFTVLAIFVAGLGLLGLAAHTAEQKTKEIGVRKVLGASSISVYTLLSREFLKCVLLANLVAWPAAYYAMHTWLQGFAFRVKIGWPVFFLSGGLALLISLAIVSYQTLKAAAADPVDSLRYE